MLRTVTILAFILSLTVQVGYPLAAILYFRRSTRTPWRLYLYGALVFATFQLFTWLPIATFVDVIWGEAIKSAWGAFAWLVAMALVATLVEEGGRLLGYRYLFPRGNLDLEWRNGVAYALGHNALETMWLIAGLTFISFVAYLIIGRMDIAAVVAAMAEEQQHVDPSILYEIADVSWTQPLIVALERVLALPHQLAWSLLVMESLASKQKRWFGFAVLYHASIAIIVPGLARLAGFAVAESVNLVFAAISVWIVARLYELSEQRG